MYKFVFFDQDDTLCPAKNKADKEIIELLEKLLEKYRVVITTWWMFKNIDTQVLSELSSEAKLENLFLFPTNAAKMYVFEDWKWIEKYAIDFTEKEIELITWVLNNAIIELDLKPEKIWWEIVENRAWSQITYSALWQQAPLEVKKLWDPTKEKRFEIIDYIKNDLKDFWIYACWTTSIDVVRKWIDKSYWVEKIMELYDIKNNEIFYVWDALYEWWNDYVVVKTWIDTKKVDNPEDTKKIIKKILL